MSILYDLVKYISKKMFFKNLTKPNLTLFLYTFYITGFLKLCYYLYMLVFFYNL